MKALDTNTNEERLQLLYGLIHNWEHEVVEFKQASNTFSQHEIGQYIMTQKFVMGAPLYRQEMEWKRNGIELSR